MRLDRLDSYLTRFGSKALTARSDADGVWIELERSAFYPTSGGQTHDIGSIGSWQVTDVEASAGRVWHRIEYVASRDAGRGPSPDSNLLNEAEAAVTAGTQLDCQIDWERRFRHMQRHTGEHLLAQAFTRVDSGFNTSAVSMRSADCTIDLTGEPDDDAIAQAEAEANRAAREALPVMAFEVEERHLVEYRLRRPTRRTGLIRLVAIGDYDVVACGGTHLRSSAEALPIKVFGSERIKGSLTRVTFRAGAEAFDALAARHAVTRSLTRLLSAPSERLYERVESVLAEAAQAQHQLGEQRAAAAAALATRLVAEARPVGEVRLVSTALSGSEAELFEPLVEALQAAPGVTSLLAASEAQQVRLAFVAGPGSGVDVRPALAAALALIGGRGGGRPDRAQGAGPGIERVVEALAAARSVLLADSPEG